MLLTLQVELIRAQEQESQLMMVVSEGPLFKGDLKKFIQENIRYPASAIQDSVEGRVVIEFEIDTTGVTEKHHVVQSVREDLDNEALRIARLIKFDIPAKQFTRVLRTKSYVIPVDFSLKPNDSKVDPNKKGKMRIGRKKR